MTPAVSIATAVAPRLLIITEIIAPYRIPVFNALAQRSEIDLQVIFLSENDPTLRQWMVYKNEITFPYSVLPHWRQRLGKYNILLNRAVHSTLDEIKPDVVVCGGYNYPAAWSAAYWAKRRSVPFLLWTESTAMERRGSYFHVESLKKRFLNLCHAFIVPGKSSLDYLKQLGVSQQRIVTARNAVDNNFYSSASQAVDLNDSEIRARYKLPPRYFLFVGRLVKEKGIFDLLEAYEQLKLEIRATAGLVFVGDGSDARELQKRTSKIQPGNVRLLGFVHREELPKIYTLAEALIFPTHTDPWGLVVNEAMACGLPVIATNVAGCTLDLVQDNWNGFVVERGDPRSLAAVMERLATDEELRRQMGNRSRERIQNYSPEIWAQGIVDAVEAVLARK
ncbi:MAG TPA: glycosyltransferase family 4 protein [Candidatus Sulfotelmatobacter sp.]